LYGCIRGIGSARELARCEESAAFRWLCGGAVNHQLLSDFRGDHGVALDELFTPVIALVDKELVSDNVRTAQHQNFAAIFLAPIVVEGGVAHLDVSAHRAVVNDNALLHGLEKVRHRKQFTVLSRGSSIRVCSPGSH
jgi:hypothetical protein